MKRLKLKIGKCKQLKNIPKSEPKDQSPVSYAFINLAIEQSLKSPSSTNYNYYFKK